MKHIFILLFLFILSYELSAQEPDSTHTESPDTLIELEEFVITERPMTTIASRITVLQTQKLGEQEFFRAACCNLSESFETNPSVDVAYNDAVTGAKQIKLLGLSGTYVQMLTENFPNFRGVASVYGLDYIPGPWLETIFISKGTSSVKNGYEAIAGQINVELKKPRPTTDIFSINLFAADNARYELNADATAILNNHLSTTVLAHYSSEEKEYDMNADGFLDTPLKRQINVMNRWEYHNETFIGQYGIRFLNEQRTGGQISPPVNPQDSLYGIKLKTNRLEIFAKNGWSLNKERNESTALILSASLHDQDSKYGFRPYDVEETNLYASWIYETDFTPMHRLSTGLSVNTDIFDENYLLNTDIIKEQKKTKETTTGAYAEYTFNKDNRLILLAGIRADYSDRYDFFLTPRMHLKYNVADWFHLRLSVGKGYRSVNVLPENNYLMASSRTIDIAPGLKQEAAWNYGTNFSFYLPVFGKELIINAEYYYTNFVNQVVTDMDSDPHRISFYNLDGKSYSSNFQLEATYPFFRGFQATAAYRISDVKTTYNGTLKTKPLMSDYKAFLSLSYQTPLKKWQCDLTSQLNGGGRMPDPDTSNPLWNKKFDAFTMLNAQVTKYFRTWSVYLGAENLLDVVQPNPIIGYDNPWGQNFDSSMVWGPLHGMKIYIGFRYNLERM